MQTIDSIEGDSPEDTALLKEMGNEAREFISSQKWCEQLDTLHLAYGVGGVVAVFLAQITPSSEETDERIWVIVGDLPSAYIVVDNNPTAADALDAYCSEMQAWVEAVENGQSVDKLIPVNAEATRENADQLRGRIEFLCTNILPLARVGRS